MTTRISKEFKFAASHSLPGLGEGHKCYRLHGHNYKVRLVVEGEVVDGMVVEFSKLNVVRDYIDTHLDHQHLNDVFQNLVECTAEFLALHLFQKASQLLHPICRVHSVRVYETDTSWAEVVN